MHKSTKVKLMKTLNYLRKSQLLLPEEFKAISTRIEMKSAFYQDAHLVKIPLTYKGIDYTVRQDSTNGLYKIADLDKIVSDVYGYHPRKSNDWIKLQSTTKAIDNCRIGVFPSLGQKGVYVDKAALLSYANYIHFDFYLFLLAYFNQEEQNV